MQFFILLKKIFRLGLEQLNRATEQPSQNGLGTKSIPAYYSHTSKWAVGAREEEEGHLTLLPRRGYLTSDVGGDSDENDGWWWL